MELLESGSCPGSATFDSGSVCNLACVTCGPDASTRWQRELGMPIVPGNSKHIDPEIVQRAQKMTGVVICGGEPMLNFSSQTMLKNLNSDQNVRVHFNGTVLPKPEFMEQSVRFKHIKYCLSIDGVGKRFEYLRWPAQWSQVVDNIQWLWHNAPDKVEFAVSITRSQLNQHYLEEITDWIHNNISSNRHGKQTVVNYNQAGDTLLSQTYLDALDQKRNLNWRELFPLAIEHIK